MADAPFNIIDKHKRLRNDDRFWRPYEASIRVGGPVNVSDERWEEIFGKKEEKKSESSGG